MNLKTSISAQKRHLHNGTQNDDLTYNYLLDNGKLFRNRLYHVNDAISEATYVGDLEERVLSMFSRLIAP